MGKSLADYIQLFQQKLSHNSTKAHATMPSGIMGSNSLALLGWGSRCLVRKKENVLIHVFVLLPSLKLKHLGLQSIKCKTIVTHNNFRHCGVHFYAFVRQPFSKPLSIGVNAGAHTATSLTELSQQFQREKSWERGWATRSFSCVCPVIDHEFRHNIVKVAADPRGDTTDYMYFDNVMTKLIVNNRTEALKTDINLFFTITNCQIVRSRSLTHRVNYEFMCLSAYYQ